MTSSIDSFIHTLKCLGGTNDLLATATKSKPSTGHHVANSHVHLPPNFSAFNNLHQAVELASDEGIDVLGASNYYDYTVYGKFATLAAKKGIFPIFGVEIIALMDELVANKTLINDPGNFGKIYICGKGITKFSPMSESATGLLQIIRENDGARMDEISHKLSVIFARAGVNAMLTPEIIRGDIAARTGVNPDTVHLQERHLAQAFQESFHQLIPDMDRLAKLQRIIGVPSKNANDPVTVQNDIRTHLMKAGKPAFVPDTFVDFDHARRLILALGGIPCYPTLADGTHPICGYEYPVERLIEELRELGVHSAEFIPNRNTSETLSHYVHAMRNAGLAVTAGTEHNTLDLLPITPTCAGGAPIPEDVQGIFWEGACVVVAHQYMSLMGLPGFVGSDGCPNPEYLSDSDRISAFRTLGEVIVMKYREVAEAWR